MFTDSLVEMPTRVFTQKVKTNTNKKCLKALKRQKILLLSESQRMKGLGGISGVSKMRILEGHR